MKLGQFQTPTGQTGNVFSLDSWIKLILGAFMFLVTFGLAQRFGKAVENRVGFLDATPEQPFEQRRVMSSGPSLPRVV